jgi:hypothetical protein
VERESVIELVDSITEFNDMSDALNDQTLDEALALVVKLLAKPDVPSVKAASLIVQLQAMSTKFKMQATYYKVMDVGRSGTEQYKRKNIYFAISDSLDKLVDAIKYLARYGS